MTGKFDWRFTELALAEKVRMQKEAMRHGLTILPIADEVQGLEAEPIVVIPSSEIPREDFSHLGDATFEKLQSYYASAEQSSVYPPLGYTPSVSREEKEAAALLSFIVTVADKWDEGALERYGYPVARVATSTPKKLSLGARLTSVFR